MKFFLGFSLLITTVFAQTPKIFEGLLEIEKPTQGQIGIVIPPQEINQYVAKVEAAARKEPEWFKTYSESNKPGIPLPYHENLGLTEKEYQQYLALWDKREFKGSETVILLLKKSFGNKFSIVANGNAQSISTLRYDPKKDVFISPNGKLERIEDIDADKNSILGEWTGKEWRLMKSNALGKIKENFAIGEFTGTKFGLLIYRVQEIDNDGRRLMDRSLVIRFPNSKK